MSTLFRATTVSALVLATIFVGCARRPGVLSSATAPSRPPAPTAQAAEDSDAVQAAVVEERQTIVERQAPSSFVENANVKAIYFDFDRYDIRPEDARTLEADAAWLKSNNVLILIEGQCDERGTDEYNLALGDRRARSAMNYLVSHGVTSDRITIVSYGEQRPLCRESAEGCWARNRRDMFLVKEK